MTGRLLCCRVWRAWQKRSRISLQKVRHSAHHPAQEIPPTSHSPPPSWRECQHWTQNRRWPCPLQQQLDSIPIQRHIYTGTSQEKLQRHVYFTLNQPGLPCRETVLSHLSMTSCDIHGFKPVPGGPYRRMRCHGWRLPVKRWGKVCGRNTASRSSCLASSRPATPLSCRLPGATNISSITPCLLPRGSIYMVRGSMERRNIIPLVQLVSLGNTNSAYK